MTDKALYQQVTEEFSTDRFDQALWSMVWTKAGGDENSARAAYVEARVREITAAGKQAKKAARAPLARRIHWPLVILILGTLVFTLINDAVARSYRPDAPAPRWDFWLVGIAGSTLGLFLFPALCILVSWGRPWGFRLGFLVLIVVGCIAGSGNAPGSEGYGFAGMCLGFLWFVYAAVAHDAGAPTTPS